MYLKLRVIHWKGILCLNVTFTHPTLELHYFFSTQTTKKVDPAFSEHLEGTEYKDTNIMKG